jgi:hypothetical protein
VAVAIAISLDLLNDDHIDAVCVTDGSRSLSDKSCVAWVAFALARHNEA